MTVAELIARLQLFEPDEPIWMEGDAGIEPVGDVYEGSEAEPIIAPDRE